MWDARLEVLDEPMAPELSSYLEHLRRLNTNGKVAFARFLVVSEPELLALFALRDGFQGIVRHIVGHATVQAHLGPVTAGAEVEDEVQFTRREALSLGGELAAALVHGGKHARWSGPLADAKALGARVAADLFGGHYHDVEVYQAESAWSDWFLAGGRDRTWLLVDRVARRLTLLCVTDED